MKLQDRIDKALERARLIADKKRRATRQRKCQGATLEEVLKFVDESILPESEPVVEDIIKQIEEYHQLPPRQGPNGELFENIHGFVNWLHGIQDGWASLPDKIPHAVFLSWRNDYARCRAVGLSNAKYGSGFYGTAVPMNRCADCHMVQPNCTPDDKFGGWIKPCPVCGSDNFEQMNFFDWGTFHPISNKDM